MNEKEALEHIEMFVQNKVREGHKGLFPKRSAKKNVESKWAQFNDKGANVDAVNALGGIDNATNLVNSTADRILNSEQELKSALSGDYSGSQEDLINEIWKD